MALQKCKGGAGATSHHNGTLRGCPASDVFRHLADVSSNSFDSWFVVGSSGYVALCFNNQKEDSG